MGPWWLYLLVFIFGYLTHKTFYFIVSTKISIGIVRISQLVGLMVLARSMENFYHSHTARVRQMREQDESEKNIRDLKRSFNMEISNYRNKAIEEMLNLHPKFYNPIVDFDNWKSAMEYLENNKQYVLQLLNQDTDDKKTS
tara:strand:- start:6767 stop:7189 length:423 start_codon:yes stop_codon:yes gene_type:complete